MKVAEITELRSEPGSLLEQDEPVLVTREGRVSGVYVPLQQPGQLLPDDLRYELIGVLGRHISGSLEARGITEKEIQEDFDAHRRRGR